jgi:hypothetical protein
LAAKEFEMERAYFLIAGILIGAAMGMLTGHIEGWICAGLAMGVVLAIAARRRPKNANEAQQLKADS